jgi:uncharacterized membrane protein
VSTLVYTLHVLLAGVWLGGVVFTMAVVSPALKATKWSEAERVGVRSVIGRQYARVGSVNLALLAVFASLDGTLKGFGVVFYAEYALLLVLFGLVTTHGAYFGRKLRMLAEAEQLAGDAEEARCFAEQRRALQKRSRLGSWLDLLVSVAVLVLAVNA